MPDGTVPSSTEALRAALSAAKASLEVQLSAGRSAAAEAALREVRSALSLLPADRLRDIEDAEWIDAEAVAAPRVLPSVPAADRRDDLTRIRGIDAALAKRLAALGIHRYEQLAAWEIEDVRVIADAMGLGRRFLAMGIAEQALELERQRREADARVPAAATRLDVQGIAIWEPKANSSPTALVRAPDAWRPLAGDDLRRAVSIIRKHLPMNRIVPLNSLVPELGTPIYIATDHDSAIELPRWRTGVLVPFVQAPEALDLTRLGAGPAHKSMPMVTPAPPRTIIMSAPLPEQHAAPAITVAPRELYAETANRLSGLEAGVDDFNLTNATLPSRSAPALVAPVPAPAAHRATARVAMPPTAAVRQSVAASSFSAAGDVGEEATVEIVTAVRGRASPLAPLPVLPLTPSAYQRQRDVAASPRAAATVEEAAVVIVKRSAPERSAGDLAFYKAAPQPALGPVRRFVRALAGT